MATSSALNNLTWPLDKLHIALPALAAAAGLIDSAGSTLDPPPLDPQIERQQLDQWIPAAAQVLGLEGEPFALCYSQVKETLVADEPLLFRLPGPDGSSPCFLVVIRCAGRLLHLLQPDLHTVTRPVDDIFAALVNSLRNDYEPQIERTLRAAGVDPKAHPHLLQGLLNKRLAGKAAAGGWHLRPGPGSSFLFQLRRHRVWRDAAAFTLAYAGQYFLWLASWALLGQAFFQGRFAGGWIIAWLLTLATILPLRTAAAALEGRVAIGIGGLLKKRLLAGALQLEPDEIRRQGTGQLLGQVLESEALETLLLAGGFQALAGTIELFFALFVLWLGAAPQAHILLLGGWLAGILFFGRLFWQKRREWTEQRLAQTYDLVEQMAGHRTRLAQMPAEDWHQEEDAALVDYLSRAAAMDRLAVWLLAAVSPAWLIAGVALLVPTFLNQPAGVEPALAISFGGLISGTLALNKLISGMLQLADAQIAGQRIGRLFRAASRSPETGNPALAIKRPESPNRQTPLPLLTTHHLSFRFRPEGHDILRGVSLTIHPGDRIRLESASGEGKTTLVALLSGLRQPQSGLVLLNGLDRQTIGRSGWRQAIATVPQFHENRMVMGTFAFNLLLGRRWPAGPEDIARARAVCHALGLGPLLEKMPAGMLQMVGETGWQLSHGEQSRMFLARAILQDADLIILDETFAALDPQNLDRCLGFVLDQEAALLVIAHP